MRTPIKNIVLCAMFTALIICGAYIKIPIPYIPITMQTTFVTLAGLILGAKKSVASTFTYLLLGLIGFPVFTGGGGISYVLRPTFGYIIGFVIGAGITGLIAQKNSGKNVKTNILAGLAGLAAIYVIGVAYYCIISKLYLHSDISFSHVFLYCFLMTAPGDIVFTVIAAIVSAKLTKILSISGSRA